MLCQLLSLYKNKEEMVWVLLKQLVQMWEEAAFQKVEEVNHIQLQYIAMLFTSVPLP